MLRPYGLAGTHSRWDALIGVALTPACSQGGVRTGFSAGAGMTIVAKVSVRGMTDGGVFFVVMAM